MLFWYYYDVDGLVIVCYQLVIGEVEVQVFVLLVIVFEVGVEKQEDVGGSNVVYWILEQDVGYFEVFYFGGDQGDFCSSIDDVIVIVCKDGVKDLLVDICNNLGGFIDNVEMLLLWLLVQECCLVFGIIEKINDISVGGWFVKGKVGELVNVDYDLMVMLVKEMKWFFGKVYFLIGLYIYLVGIVMVMVVQDCVVGMLVGELMVGFVNQIGQIYFFDLFNICIWVFVLIWLLFCFSGDCCVGGVQFEYLLMVFGVGQEVMVEQVWVLVVFRC